MRLVHIVLVASLVLPGRVAAQEALGPPILIPADAVGRIDGPSEVFAASDSAALVAWSAPGSIHARYLGATHPTWGTYATSSEELEDLGGVVAGELATLAWSVAGAVYWTSLGPGRAPVEPRTVAFPVDASISLRVAAAGSRAAVVWTVETATGSQLAWVTSDEGALPVTLDHPGTLRAAWCGTSECMLVLEGPSGLVAIALDIDAGAISAALTLPFLPVVAAAQETSGSAWTVHAMSPGALRVQSLDVSFAAMEVGPTRIGPALGPGTLMGAGRESAFVLDAALGRFVTVRTGEDVHVLDAAAYPSLVAGTTEGSIAGLSVSLAAHQLWWWSPAAGQRFAPRYEATENPSVIGIELSVSVSSAWVNVLRYSPTDYLSPLPWGNAFVRADADGTLTDLSLMRHDCVIARGGYGCLDGDGRVRMEGTGLPRWSEELSLPPGCRWPELAAQGAGFLVRCGTEAREVAHDGSVTSAVVPSATEHSATFIASPGPGRYAMFDPGQIGVVSGDSTIHWYDIPIFDAFNTDDEGTHWVVPGVGFRRVRWTAPSVLETRDDPGLQIVSFDRRSGLVVRAAGGTPEHEWLDQTYVLSRLREDGSETIPVELIPLAEIAPTRIGTGATVECEHAMGGRCAVILTYDTNVDTMERAHTYVRWVWTAVLGEPCTEDVMCATGWCVDGACAAAEGVDGGYADGGSTDVGPMPDASSIDATVTGPEDAGQRHHVRYGCGCGVPTPWGAPAPLWAALLAVFAAARRLTVSRRARRIRL